MSVTNFNVKPITKEDLDSVNQDCWESQEIQIKILASQEILGFGAWIDSVCVGSLHCYKVNLPEWDESLFPAYGRKRLEDWPLGWPLLAAKAKNIIFNGPVWGHACFHVGRLVNTHDSNRDYFGQGIGKALLDASINWAKEHKYAGIIAHGGSKSVLEYNVVMGCLPWTSYEQVGFEVRALEGDGVSMPWWATATEHSWGDAILKEQITKALTNRDGLLDICARLMVLRIGD